VFRQISASFAALLAGVVLATASAAESPPAQKVIGAYYPGGSAERYPISRIPADKLTHLFYAFARIEKGRCVVKDDASGHFAALSKLKSKHPQLRTIISIGGWTADGFSDAALTAQSRKRFVSSCIALFFDRHRGSFDGFDIDWEYPVYGGPEQITSRPQDRGNMTLLVREFRRQLDAIGKQRKQHLLVTAALPAGRLQSAGPFDQVRSFELDKLAEVLDFINLMTYDMGTSFSPVSAFNAPLHEVESDPMDPQLRQWNSVAGAVDYYRGHGVPAGKLVLGVPFYGRGFHVSSDANDGLYQAYTAPYGAGDWRVIKEKLLTDPQWEQHWHPVAQTPWLFHRGDRIFVSYEDPRSIAIRAEYAREQGLRGVFMWELTGDDDQHSLLEAMTKPFE
jgi:chitinase